MTRKRNSDVGERLAGLAEERVEPGRVRAELCFLAALNGFCTSALVTLMPSLSASAWYQYALIRKSSTWLLSAVNACWQSPRSVVVSALARVGTSALACAMQLVNFGGSLGTITGEPGVCAAWLLAATYIQWLNAWVEIGLPATSTTASPGTPLPQPAMPTRDHKKGA